jgi:hypothetical protein
MAPTNALRLVLLCFGRVIVVAGVLLLVSGLSVVSCALTIASGVLWMGAATNDDSFASALARLARAPRGCCLQGVDALRGVAIAGIVVTVLESLGVILWGLAVMQYSGEGIYDRDYRYGENAGTSITSNCGRSTCPATHSRRASPTSPCRRRRSASSAR